MVTFYVIIRWKKAEIKNKKRHLIYKHKFTSGMFTALSNGIISAVLAFSRSFVFMMITMLVLPVILGVNGIWLATPVAEFMALALSLGMFIKYKRRYQY